MSVIGVVGSAVGGVELLREGLVLPLLDRGHTAAVTLTPRAAEWVAPAERWEIERVTGLPVRSQPRRPGEPKPHPPIELFVAAPVGANTVAKLALGICDNQAMTVLCEAIGSVPMVVFPRVNAAHARHPAWAGHLDTLRKAGVVLVEWELREAGTGDDRPLPWDRILAAVDDLGDQLL